VELLSHAVLNTLVGSHGGAESTAVLEYGVICTLLLNVLINQKKGGGVVCLKQPVPLNFPLVLLANDENYPKAFPRIRIQHFM